MVTLNTTEAQIRRVGGDFQDLLVFKIICLNFDLPYIFRIIAVFLPAESFEHSYSQKAC